jgi:hypothetical protein
MIKYDEETFDGIVGNPDFIEEFERMANESEYKNVTSYKDKILVALLSNPRCTLKFRNDDLATLDEVAKDSMIKKIQGLLGIKPLLND